MSNLKVIALTCTTLLPTTALADWNGWYGGLSYGSVSDSEFTITSGTGADVELTNTDNFGGFVGTMTQNGTLVYGGEIEFSSITDMTGDNGDFTVAVDTVTIDLKTRVGYAFQDVLAYGVFGVSTYSIENDLINMDFEQSGLNLGLGVDYLVTDNLFFGVEYLSRFPSGVVEIIGTNGQIEHESQINSISLRAGFTF